MVTTSLSYSKILYGFLVLSRFILLSSAFKAQYDLISYLHSILLPSAYILYPSPNFSPTIPLPYSLGAFVLTNSSALDLCSICSAPPPQNHCNTFPVVLLYMFLTWHFNQTRGSPERLCLTHLYPSWYLTQFLGHSTAQWIYKGYVNKSCFIRLAEDLFLHSETELSRRHKLTSWSHYSYFQFPLKLLSTSVKISEFFKRHKIRIVWLVNGE